MQNGDCYFSKKENNKNLKIDNSNEEHKYYIRLDINNNNFIPEQWIEKKENYNDFCIIITKNIKLAEINNLLKDKKDCFYAKIGRNVLW